LASTDAYQRSNQGNDRGAPSRLAALVVLGADREHRGAPTLTRLGVGAAAVEVLAHSFQLDPTDVGLLASSLRRSASIASGVAVFRLAYPRSFPALPEVCATIERELAP
jgi:hypothetical protein